MKSLHLCNLANVAYGYCKILREVGHETDLRCHDLRHLMSQPEWDDLELNSSDFPDEYDFWRNTADFGNYRRPDWFESSSMLQDEPKLKRFGRHMLPVWLKNRLRPFYYRYLAGKARMQQIQGRVSEASRRQTARMLAAGLGVADRTGVSFLVPERLKLRYRPSLSSWVRLEAAAAAAANATHAESVDGAAAPATTVGASQRWTGLTSERVHFLMEQSRLHGPQWALSVEDIYQFHLFANWMDRHLDGHEVTVAYVLSPIYAMLHGETPYVSVEIGTMRDIPFEDSPTGRMLALSYRLSDHILITNPDVVTSAERLGLERDHYSFCPHPVDEDKYCPGPATNPLRSELLAKYGVDHILFAPARQNWEIKGNDKYLRAFARLLRQGVKAVLIVPGWGQEVPRSQKLCEELGIADKVAWVSPMSEPLLVKYYQACDVVLDQFELGVFGLVTCKALSCSAPVVTSYDKAIHSWCFAEHPPILHASTEDEIFHVLRNLLPRPDRLKQIGVASRNWVLGHHSKQVVRDIFDHATAAARIRFERKRRDLKIVAPDMPETPDPNSTVRQRKSA